MRLTLSEMLESMLQIRTKPLLWRRPCLGQRARCAGCCLTTRDASYPVTLQTKQAVEKVTADGRSGRNSMPKSESKRERNGIASVKSKVENPFSTVVRCLIARRKSTPDDLVAAGVMVLSAVEVRRMMAFSDVAPRCEDRDERGLLIRSRRDELRGRRRHRPGRTITSARAEPVDGRYVMP
jgi:hypothetical protein